MKFNLLLPTRGRPEGLKKALKQIENTVSGKHKIEIKILLDLDDEKLEENRVIILESSCGILKNVHYNRDKIKGSSALWNYLYSKADKDADILGMISDDTYIKTKDWDDKMADASKQYEDEIYLIGVDDGYFAAWASHYFVSKKACDILGYFCWRDSLADYAETWMMYIFRRLNRIIYLPDIEIYMKHPYLHSEVEKDETYKMAEEIRKEFDIRSLYFSKEKRDERKRDTKKLIDYIRKRKGFDLDDMPKFRRKFDINKLLNKEK